MSTPQGETSLAYNWANRDGSLAARTKNAVVQLDYLAMKLYSHRLRTIG